MVTRGRNLLSNRRTLTVGISVHAICDTAFSFVFSSLPAIPKLPGRPGCRHQSPEPEDILATG